MDTRPYIRLVRPRQWTKNLAVFAAIIFSGTLFVPGYLVRVSLAFVALCCVASGFYALNDVVDADRDRQHPVKRSRPVASGELTVRAALVASVGLLVVGFALSALLGLSFMLAVLGYAALQMLYSYWFKHVAIVDMLVIASGFVIRAVGGALVISVAVSPWLVLCTGLLALFLASAKRRHELVLLQDQSSGHRPVLAQYSGELLDSFMVTLSAATIGSYALYTFFEHRAPGYTLMLTIPFVIYGVLRYQVLVFKHLGGGRPEDVLLGDVPMMADVALWVVTSVALLYGGPMLVRLFARL